ncbi:MAG: fasciclin domain-containing protein [Phycisphaerales bacterium]
MQIDRVIIAGAFAAFGIGSAGVACPPVSCSGGKQALVAHAAPAKGTIVEVAQEAGTFKTLVAAVQAAGLVETLSGKGPFTVFAPTDEAFAKIGKKTLDDLLKPENRDQLKAILTYHVVAGSVNKGAALKVAQAGGGAATVNGQRAGLMVKDGSLLVAGAKVVAADVEASNGVIHVIDTVIMPATADLAETAMKAGKFNTLVAAAKAAGLVEALKGSDPLTVFAPTDEAFAKLPAGILAKLLKPENKEALKSILLYHIAQGRVYSDQVLKQGELATLQGGKLMPMLEGSQARVNRSTIISTDIDARNGVIHVIDAVLLPEGLKLDALK